MREAVPSEQQIPADHGHDNVAQTVEAALVLDAAFGEQRSHHPDNKKNAPADADNVFHEHPPFQASPGVRG